ncbi:MAG TPA: helix-hairpin-helix domain-containing protein [Vicinamibacterales bacterium]
MRRCFGCVVVTMVALAIAAPVFAQRPTSESSSQATSSPLNLNAATATQLESLPGIGARTAERIIEYRQKNGGFKKIEELMNVRGVGEKSFLKLKPLITVVPPKVEASGQAAR